MRLFRNLRLTKHRRINLALQGGGSHGALTWGVIEAILEDENVEISAVSGTSAGAVNAVALAAGLMEDGRDGAHSKLNRIWRKVSELGGNYPFKMPSLYAFSGNGNVGGKLDHLSLDLMTRMFSPAVLNPLDIDPLRSLLDSEIDFKGLRERPPVKLFIAATDIANGRARIFTEREISADRVLASACLPNLRSAVEIDGRHFWDGGYSANPPLLPLIRDTSIDDTLLVQLNAFPDERVPNSSREIIARVNLLAFSQPLTQEVFLIKELRRLACETGVKRSNHARRILKHRFHLIDGSLVTRDLSQESKLYTDWGHLCELRDRGREIAKAWLATHAGDVGRRATTDLTKRFL